MVANRQLLSLLLHLAGILFAFLATSSVSAQSASDEVKAIVVRAPRDLGFFAGDLVRADVDLVVQTGHVLETASLPHPGPVDYWLDLRSIDVAEHADPQGRRYTLAIVYQEFYDALDVRPMEIPAIPIFVRSGEHVVAAEIPAWTIMVSALREVAPPVKDDPKDYMRADHGPRLIAVDHLWQLSGAAAIGAILAFVVLARDKAWWPFHDRPTRVFSDVVRQLRNIGRHPLSDSAYLQGLLVLHRAIDRADNRRVLADDVPEFVRRHPMFIPLAEGFSRFFMASRQAFFAEDPTRARTDLPFSSLEAFARQLAVAERTRP